MQAAKLLQLNKSTTDDVETMYDLCFLLTPAQIRKLLTMFTPGEFEPPVSDEILQAVAERCLDGGENAAVMLDVHEEGSVSVFRCPQPRPVDRIERNVPAYLELRLPRIKHLLYI
jgi:myosin-5